MRRRVIVVAAALAVTATLGSPNAGAPPRPPTELYEARVCTGRYYDDLEARCDVDERHRVLRDGEFVCGVFVRVARPTRLTIRLRYQGRVQRSSSQIVRADGPRHLGVDFPNLDVSGAPPLPQEGLPRGRYGCEFLLGSKRVSFPFRSGGPRGRVLAPFVCRLTGGDTPIDPRCTSITLMPRAHAAACSAVFVRVAGRPMEIHILREEQEAWKTLHVARTRVEAPISAEWAYAAAPRGQFLPAGKYECRFLLDGKEVVRKPFELAR